MHWTVISPFFRNQQPAKNSWLIPFIPGTQHEFELIARPEKSALSNWDRREFQSANYTEWFRHMSQANEAWKKTKGGIIAILPQPSAMVGLRKKLSFKNIPVVAWAFNLSTCFTGLKGTISRFTLNDIDTFVVHSRRERDLYSQWLKLPRNRFEYIPFYRSKLSNNYEEIRENPFLVSMGTANRDYATLFKVVEELNIPTIVVAAPFAVNNLNIPPQVEVKYGISIEDCHRLSQEARLNVIPIKNIDTAAGQITFVDAMMLGRAIIATKTTGSEDYIFHEDTGILVKPNSVQDLKNAIEILWADEEKRKILGANAKKYAYENFTKEKAGKALGRILDSYLNRKSERIPRSLLRG